MLYNLTLRDLDIPGSRIGVCLRLHGCQEVIETASMNRAEGFIDYLFLGKIIGYQIIAAGLIPTILAVEVPPFSEQLMKADADAMELRTDDPMYRVANDYNSHQLMREVVRDTLRREMPRARGAELQQMRQNLCALSMWLAMHDPDFGNAVRERMLACLKTFNHAMLTVACSKRRAYVRSINPVPVDLSEDLKLADQSSDRATVTSGVLGRRRHRGQNGKP